MKLALATLAVASGAGLTQLQSLVVPRASGVAAFANTVYVRAGVGSLGQLRVFARDARSSKLRQLQCVARHAARCTDGRGLETPSSIAVSPDGHSLYVTATNGRAVGVYARAANGKLTARGSVGGLSHPQSVAVSPDGRSVYVGGDRLWVFARAASSALSLVERQPVGAQAVAVAPDGSAVYAGSGGGYHGSLAAFARDPATGTLTETATVSSPATPGIEQPAQLVATRDGLYAVGAVSGAVTRFDATLAETGIARSLPLAFGLAVSADRVVVAYRDGVAVLDRDLHRLGAVKLRRATGVAAVWRSIYAVSAARVTAYRR
ncbi:MAG: lactonase family protein [Gaiellaceae bacterium]